MKLPMLRISAAAAVTALSVTILVPTSASASNGHDWSELRQFFTKYNVSEAVQEHLVEKLESGDLLDSMGGERPVSVHSYVAHLEEVTISTFADGSISVGTVETAPTTSSGSIRPRSVSGCYSYQSAGVAISENCRITGTNGLTTIGFISNYHRSQHGAGVSHWRDPSSRTQYGSASLPTFVSSRANSSGTTPAHVTIHSRFSSVTSSEDLYLSLRVTSGGARTTPY